MKRTYVSPKEGEEFVIKDWHKMTHHICCCDCGLVHEFDFTVIKKDIIVKVWRDNRATGQMRRHRKIKITEGG